MNHLRGVAYLTCGDWHLAEDAVSTGMARLYVHWARIDNPESYARRVVINAAIDERRRPWRRERVAGDTLPDVEGPDPSHRSDDRSYLLAALKQLPRGQRAVVVLRFYEGLSIEQVAQILGRSTGTVKSQAARGLTALRAVLDSTAAHGAGREDAAFDRPAFDRPALDAARLDSARPERTGGRHAKVNG